MRNRTRPIHPGEIPKADVLDALGLSASALAKALGVPTNRITAIVNEERVIAADTALRLARYLGGDPQFWLNLQTLCDLRKAEIEAGKTIERKVKPRAACDRRARSRLCLRRRAPSCGPGPKGE